MKKIIIFLLLSIGVFGSVFAQNEVTITEAKTALTFKKTQTNGVIIEKTYPLTDVTYTYEVAINHLSIFYIAPTREVIYSGLASLVTIDGVSGGAGVLLLKDAIGNASSSGAALQAIADKIDTTNNHLAEIGQKVSTEAKQDTSISKLTILNAKVSTEAKQDTIITKLSGLTDAMATEAKQDTTISKLTILNAKVSTEAKQDTIITKLSGLTDEMATEAKQDTTISKLTILNAKVSTEAKQDTIITKLSGLTDAMATEAKQDTTISKLTILNAKVSTEAKQDTIIARLDSLANQGEYITKIGTTNTFLLKDSTVTLSGSTLLYWTACNTGFINADIQFAGETTATMLIPGMCYTETIWTDPKSKIVHEPSTATITAANGSQVHIIRKYR